MVWFNLYIVMGFFASLQAAYLVSKMVFNYQKETTPHYKSSMDPEIFMNATELITSKGFPCENYWITTADGYILNILRIPHGRRPNSNHKGPKPVVVLQHGLLGSATNFLTNLVNQSLAYILADAGADVWLGNSRGNLYSMNHTTLNPEDEAFWQFTFDEMAKYDLPAMINFILKQSGSDQVYYVGHSQGTTIGFIQFGQDQELASHIKHFFAMGPVGRVTHISGPYRVLAPFARNLYDFFEGLGHGKFMAASKFARQLSAYVCETWREALCLSMLFMGSGFDYSSFNLARVPVYEAHNPAGSSVANILHFVQEVNAGEFQMFDYGSPEANIQHYGQTSPPLYDPSKVKVPVAVFSGSRDWLADPKDVNWLLPQLNVTHNINIEHYAHLDFIWAIDAPILIYDTILKVLFQ